MRFRISVFQCALAFSVFLLPCLVSGQGLQPVPARTVGSRIASLSSPTERFSETEKPYRLTSRIHLLRGGDTGYVVVRVEMKKGSHINSLTQTGDIPPTKITVAPSRRFVVTGRFGADRPPKVIENDPVFGQRVEEHSGVIQFFAPIKIAANQDATTLNAELVFKGQICTMDNICIPIFNRKIVARFAGYFDRKAEKRGSSQNGTSGKPSPSSDGKLRR